MRCRAARRRFSAYRDGELPAAEARALRAHLRSCAECEGRWRSGKEMLDLLAELPEPEWGDGIAGRVLSRLEVESRGPGLALIFRPVWASRPLILPSLVPAALVFMAVLGAALALDRDRGPLREAATPVAALDDWNWEWAFAMPLSTPGSEGYPYPPSGDVSAPRVRRDRTLPEDVLADMGEGSVFITAVVARDGSVSGVTLLQGDREQARPLMEALRHERFEPGRLRGQPVAVSIYRLISRMDVLAPLT